MLVVPAAAHAACQGAAEPPRSEGDARAKTLCLLNLQRRIHGLPALQPDHRLRTAASSFSRDMVRRRFFNHVGPDGSTLQQRLASAGYRGWRTIGENIAWGSGALAAPASIVEGWMNSPGHRANILNGSFREIGVGVAAGAPMGGIGEAAAVYTTDFGA